MTSIRRRTRLLSIAVAGALALTACGTAGSATGSSGSGGASGGSGGAITVGSANFPENQLLAEIYSQALEAKGVTVTRKFNIGSREVYIKALDDGSIDLLPEYTGALLDYYATAAGKENKASTPDDVLKELTTMLPSTLALYDKSAAEDKDAYSVLPETAKKYNLKTLEDLKPVAGELVIGGSPESETRYQGLVGLQQVYGLNFKSYSALDAGGPLTIKALVNGDIQVADIFSTQSELKTYKLVVLEDPKNLFVAQNIIPLITKAKGSDTIKSTLNKVSAALTTEKLTDALYEVTVDKSDYDTVAKKFIDDNGLSK